MSTPVCLITGVGPGTGSALARKFAEGGYRVALLARSGERLAALEKELPNAKGYRCDVSDLAQVEATASAVERDLGVRSRARPRQSCCRHSQCGWRGDRYVPGD